MDPWDLSCRSVRQPGAHMRHMEAPIASGRAVSAPLAAAACHRMAPASSVSPSPVSSSVSSSSQSSSSTSSQVPAASSQPSSFEDPPRAHLSMATTTTTITTTTTPTTRPDREETPHLTSDSSQQQPLDRKARKKDQNRRAAYNYRRKKMEEKNRLREEEMRLVYSRVCLIGYADELEGTIMYILNTKTRKILDKDGDGVRFLCPVCLQSCDNLMNLRGHLNVMHHFPGATSEGAAAGQANGNC